MSEDTALIKLMEEVLHKIKLGRHTEIYVMAKSEKALKSVQT